MNRLFRISLVFVLALIISTPTWAYSGSSSKYKRHYKKSKHYGHYLSYFNYKKIKVWVQYRRLIRAYQRAGEDARQKFLNKIGLDQPDTSGEVERIREEYERQIALLNSTIADNEQQILQLNTTNTSNAQQIAQLNDTIISNEQQINQLNTTISSHAQVLADLRASHQTDMNELAEEWRLRAEAEYARGEEQGRETCQTTPSGTGAYAMVNSWSTGGFNPNTVDVDGSGNVYILDNVNRTVVRYDSSGGQAGHWGSPSFEAPVDMATDSQGDIFILDQQSEYHLQRYGSDGMAIDMPSTRYDLVAPTGFFIDASDTLYVVDSGGAYGGRIVAFNSSGYWIMQVGEVPQLSGQVYLDIAVNPQDQTMVVLTDSNVAVFDQNGTYERDWTGDFTAPTGLAIGNQGEIYVVDGGSHQVFEYDADGTVVDIFGMDDLLEPGRQDVDENGMFFVGDMDDQQIKVFGK